MAAYMGSSFNGGLPAVATAATMHHAQNAAGREQQGFPAYQTLRHSPQRHHGTGPPCAIAVRRTKPCPVLGRSPGRRRRLHVLCMAVMPPAFRRPPERHSRGLQMELISYPKEMAYEQGAK